MNRTETKLYIKSQLTNYLEQQGIDISKPFNCLNPEHPDTNPSMRYDATRNRVHCFSCGAGGDIIDLIRLEYGLTEDKDKFTKAYELLGVKDEQSTYISSNTIAQDVVHTPSKINDASSLPDTHCINYLNHRNVSLETAKKYGLSFERDWISPKALEKAKKENKKYPPSSPRLIIPTSNVSYVAIDVRPAGLFPNQENFRKMKEGKVHVFNAKALQEEKPCFVVEGELDALSFLEIGYNAVALGSVSNTKIFMNELKQLNVKSPLILALDNDNAGNKATADLEKQLHYTDCSYIVADTIYQNYKDANDYLRTDKQAFITSSSFIVDNLRVSLECKRLELEEKLKLEQENYKNTSVYNELDQFKKDVESTKDNINISTGFAALDEELGGGLVEGLYVIGALTSLGKTTFAMQIADSLANQDLDVLYFSLEMSKSLLISKSISRHTLLYCLQNNINTSIAKTSRGILDGRRYKNYNSHSLMVIENAYEKL